MKSIFISIVFVFLFSVNVYADSLEDFLNVHDTSEEEIEEALSVYYDYLNGELIPVDEEELLYDQLEISEVIPYYDLEHAAYFYDEYEFLFPIIDMLTIDDWNDIEKKLEDGKYGIHKKTDFFKVIKTIGIVFVIIVSVYPLVLVIIGLIIDFFDKFFKKDK